MPSHPKTASPPLSTPAGVRTLSKQANINIDCDRRVGKYMIDPDPARLPQNNPQLPTEMKCFFSSQGKINTTKLKDHIILHRYEKAIVTKLKDKFHWPDSVFQTIDWDSHREAARATSQHKYINIAKSIFG